MRSAIAVVTWALVALAACGDNRTIASSADADDIVDQRVQLPASDPGYVDYITPDVVIAPGDTKMFCYTVEQTLPELVVDQIHVLQGPHGHHVSVMTSTTPSPVGTFEDCTSPAANANLRWLILTTGPLPPGSAMSMAQGERLVLQFHYINSSDSPVRVNTVVRFHQVDPTTVTRWVATTVASDVSVQVTPGLSHHEFECKLSADRTLIGMFPHMHEYGADIAIDMGPDADHLTRIMSEDPWSAAFYNDPPWQGFDPGTPLPAGTVIKTSCSWQNDTGATLIYPTEMCMTFTWLAGSKTPATCD